MKAGFILAFVLCLALCLPVKATETQTRYFAYNYPDYHFSFYPQQSVGSGGSSAGFMQVGDLDTWYGVRVYEYRYNLTFQEFTSGSPVAVVYRSENGAGYQSNTWTCPETAFNISSIFHIEFWFYFEGIGWTDKVDFWSEPLTITSLASSSWTCTYYTQRDAVNYGGTWYTMSYFYWGDSFYNSRVENVQVVLFESAGGLSFSAGFILAMIAFLMVGIVVGAGIRKGTR